MAISGSLRGRTSSRVSHSSSCWWSSPSLASWSRCFCRRFRRRESARRTQCNNQVRQVGLAILSYELSKKQFPSSVGPGPYGYIASILGYFEEQNLHDLIDFTVRWSDPKNDRMREKELPFLRCPSQERFEPTQIYDVGLGNTYQILDTPLRAHYYAVNGAKLDNTCPGLTPFEVTSCGAEFASRGGHSQTASCIA